MNFISWIRVIHSYGCIVKGAHLDMLFLLLSSGIVNANIDIVVTNLINIKLYTHLGPNADSVKKIQKFCVVDIYNNGLDWYVNELYNQLHIYQGR